LPETHTAVIRGDVAMGFTFFNAGGDLIQSGKMRALAVTGAKRLIGLPDIPTFKEAGVPEFEYDSWFGIWRQPARRGQSSPKSAPTSPKRYRLPT